MSNLARMFDFETGLEFNPDLKVIKGKNKNIVNNMSLNRWVDPIRDKNDIKNIYNYLVTRAESDGNKNGTRYLGKCRDALIFAVGINIGLRVSDLTSLKWENIFETGTKFWETARNIKEKKTSKLRGIYLNQTARRAVMEYLDRTGITPEPEKYVFTNFRKNGGRVSDDVVGKILKEACRECGVKGNYYTHSLRKTFAYQMYMTLNDANDPLALPKVQKFLNHRNQSDTLRYLGLSKGEAEDLYNMMDIGVF